MASHNDIKDILDIPIAPVEKFITKKMLFNHKKTKVKKTEPVAKRPEGMARELWGLIINDNSEPSMVAGVNCGYKRQKARIGQSRVRKWRWTQFSNSARDDNALFYHWTRESGDLDQEYPFAHFNKKIELPEYTEEEYNEYLKTINDGIGVCCTPWTRRATDSLMDLCKRYDARFPVVADRWESDEFGSRTIEELKQRYYDICNVILRLRCGVDHPKVQSIREYDGEHEKKRKLQLEKMWSRTEEMIEEEEYLSLELKKIEIRKKERDKKTRDLQKMISAADIVEPKSKQSSDRGRKMSSFGRPANSSRSVGRPSTNAGRPSNQSNAGGAGIKAIAAIRKNGTSKMGSGAALIGRGSRFKKKIKQPKKLNSTKKSNLKMKPIIEPKTDKTGSEPGNKRDEASLPLNPNNATPPIVSTNPAAIQQRKSSTSKSSNTTSTPSDMPLTFLTCSVSTLIDISPDGSFKNADVFGVHGINFQDQRVAGISLISNKLKLPTNLGVKKIKEIEQNLVDVKVDIKPIATEDIIEVYNEIRSDSMTLQQLKTNLASSTYELEAVHQQMSTLKPQKPLKRKQKLKSNKKSKKRKLSKKSRPKKSIRNKKRRILLREGSSNENPQEKNEQI